MAAVYDLKEQERIYARWAGIYDAIYQKILAPAQKEAAQAAAAVGGRVLEVGVGTGLALRYYPASMDVVGIDLSLPMLQKARAKVQAEGLDHVTGLAAMDACNLAFADGAFDCVTVPFVITLVPDPEGALTEIARVVRVGGEIIIASRLGAEKGVQASVEKAVAPLVKKVGWSSDFKLSRIARWAEDAGNVQVVGVTQGLYFTVVRLRKRP
jgi:phosphatidylethanolamine/phosphatidyl-N-methylethanolamine N-methyltransferase